MPAHLTMITPPRCHHAGCRKEARRRLVDTYNTTIGDYCEDHASTQLQIQRERERDNITYAASVGRLPLA